MSPATLPAPIASGDRVPCSAPRPCIPDPWRLDSIQPHELCSKMTREEQAGLVETIFSSMYPEEYQHMPCCVHWAYVACTVLRACGHRAILQAGSLHWPVLPMTEPTRPTHFSYEFDLSQKFSREAMRRGGLPEIHCWIGLPDAPGGAEIVDFSTRSLKGVAVARYGLTWELPDPPRYLWCKAHELPERVYYVPKLDAIAFMLAYCERKGGRPT